MAALSANVVLTGDPDDWIAVAWDAETHAFGGEAPILNGSFSITGLTAGRAYMVACRPKTGPAWKAEAGFSLGNLVIPTNPIAKPYIFKATTATPRDPEFSKVVALLHMDGANDGTTFSEVTGKTVTRYGAVTKTSVKKFGTASAYFDGIDDYLTIADSPGLNLGTGDFTIELWAYGNRANQSQSFPRFLAKGNFGTLGAWNLVWIASTGDVYFDIYTPSTVGLLVGTMPNDAWSHMAITRSGSNVQTFMNGVVGSSVSNSTNLNITSTLAIGAQSSGSGVFRGYIDEVRITKGFARYTSPFTPPSSPFVDTAGALSGNTEPEWPTNTDETVSDGDITWSNMGRLIRPLIQGPAIAG